MNLQEILALALILLRFLRGTNAWLHRLHACGVSTKNFTSSGPDFFLAVIRR